MIWIALSFVLGLCAGAFAPDGARAWVRGRIAAVAVMIGGRLQPRQRRSKNNPNFDFVANFGSRETVSRETPRETVRPQRRKIPIRIALGNLGAALLQVALWVARHPVLAAGIFILVLWVLVARDLRLPFDFAKSREELRSERDAALVDKQVAERERELFREAIDLAEATERDHARVERIITEAEEHIADAVDDADFDRLFIAYERAYLSVWDNVRPSDDDSAPGAIDGLRGFSANPA